MDFIEALGQPFPDEWRRILVEHVPFYRGFDPPTRARFEEQLKVFIGTKRFFSPDRDFVISDVVRVVVAATACRLSLNLPGEYYTRLKVVSVLPGRELSGTRAAGTGSATSAAFAWDAVLEGLRREHDGDNLGYHEFAHVLDGSDGDMDGIPRGCAPDLYRRWVAVLDKDLATLRAAKEHGLATLLSHYGATNETEFFAVATENFFERPLALRRHHPELYATLASYYRQDPAG